jgi:arylsulfatase A-like enzyme
LPGIGQVIDYLKQNGLYEDTFILFTGDNGPSSEYRNNMDGREVSFSGVSAGGLKGYKYSLFEGGIR